MQRTADGHPLRRDLGQLELVDAVLVAVVAHLGREGWRARRKDGRGMHGTGPGKNGGQVERLACTLVLGRQGALKLPSRSICLPMNGLSTHWPSANNANSL